MLEHPSPPPPAYHSLENTSAIPLVQKESQQGRRRIKLLTCSRNWIFLRILPPNSRTSLKSGTLSSLRVCMHVRIQLLGRQACKCHHYSSQMFILNQFLSCFLWLLFFSRLAEELPAAPSYQGNRPLFVICLLDQDPLRLKDGCNSQFRFHSLIAVQYLPFKWGGWVGRKGSFRGSFFACVFQYLTHTDGVSVCVCVCNIL